MFGSLLETPKSSAFLGEKKQEHSGFFASLNRKVLTPRKKGARFIVFEGLEGSGQNTQAGLIRDYLEERGVDTLLTKEPTIISEAGRRAVSALNKEIDISPKELQELFADDRREHLRKVIMPALDEGRMVISDRYFFSSFAYGSIDCKLKWLMRINGDFIFPDAVFILSTPPAVCYDRIIGRRSSFQFFEEREKLERAANAYEKLARKFDDVYLLNGEQSTEGVFYAILLKVLKL